MVQFGRIRQLWLAFAEIETARITPSKKNSMLLTVHLPVCPSAKKHMYFTQLPAPQVSAHRPLQINRMAVHEACGREMADALRDYREWKAINLSSSKGHLGAQSQDNSEKRFAHDSEVSVSFEAYQTATGTGLGKRTRASASRERTTELQRTPIGWRTLRWLMMRRQEELRSQAAEAQAMFREDMEQRHKER